MTRYRVGKVGPQFGYKRIVVRDVASVGAPKVLEAWIEEREWRQDSKRVIDRLYEVAGTIRHLERDQMQVEFP